MVGCSDRLPSSVGEIGFFAVIETPTKRKVTSTVGKFFNP